MFHKLHVLGINDDLWDRVSGLGSELYEQVTHMFILLMDTEKLLLVNEQSDASPPLQSTSMP